MGFGVPSEMVSDDKDVDVFTRLEVDGALIVK